MNMHDNLKQYYMLNQEKQTISGGRTPYEAPDTVTLELISQGSILESSTKQALRDLGVVYVIPSEF